MRLSLNIYFLRSSIIVKLKVNQKVKIYHQGEYDGGEGFVYKLDRFARTYSISTDDGKFFEFKESDLGRLFDAI